MRAEATHIVPGASDTLALLPGSRSSLVGETLLNVLGDADARLYREIFRLQDLGKWNAAEKLIKQLSDPLLMGHVKFQRYMHPRAYRSRYEELSGWMKKYADHPGAQRLYKLAVKRRPKNWNWPRKPRQPAVRVARDITGPAAEPAKTRPSFARRYTRRMASVQRRVRRYIRSGAPTAALRMLSDKKNSRYFDDIGYDQSLAVIARGYFHAGMDEEALENAGAAAARSGAAVPESHWWAGLAAWRLYRYDLAAFHFEAMANSASGDEWLVSAGAYWAARAWLVDRQPTRVVPMLKRAAEFPLTFYGILGQEALALNYEFDWSLPPVSLDAARKLLDIPAVRRGLALVQVGRQRSGMAELKRVVRRLPRSLLQTLMTASDEAGLASVTFQVGRALDTRHGHWHGAALFPLPNWTPTGGFNVDRALIFAVMRQESNFKTNAKSRAGARGLMQLMPGTAGFMAGRRFRGARRDQLYDPGLNIALGQKYVRHLLEIEPGIEGNLFYVAAAYNGGPGNLRKWLRGMGNPEDPLLFMESIPRTETRDYVELVMTNLWIYRDRLGQPRPSLARIAAGGWPVYSALDPPSRQVALRNATGESSLEN